MAAAVEELLGEHICAGWVNVPRGYEPAVPLRRIHIHAAGHPLPDAAGVAGTRRILALLKGLGEHDLVLFLLSGGASALLELPPAGVSLGDLRHLTEALLRSGATIAEVNTVRKHLSRVKGGRLAQLAAHSQVAVLVLSDVVGSALEAIGSGPFVPGGTTCDQAWSVLERYGLTAGLPASVSAALRQPAGGRNGPLPAAHGCIYHCVIADNRTAATAATERARRLGLNAQLVTTYLEGEAREVGRVLAALAKEVARHGEPLPRPAGLVLGGETTVTVRGPGKGGRNQEAALAAALALDGWQDVMVATLATDGTDGPTDAAGAVVTGETAARARALGLDPAACLARNDAYPLLDAVGGLIRTGPTGTNVNDLAFVLVW
jgi:hydroxypyruvate reductase